MYDIGFPELKITEKTTDENNYCTYQATVKTSPAECPECGSVHIVKHKKHDRMVRDLNEYEHRVGIIIHGHRYQCGDYLNAPAVDGGVEEVGMYIQSEQGEQ